MMKFAVILAFLVVPTTSLLTNVTVKGVAACHKRAVVNARMQLFDRDRLDPNDVLATVHTNVDGKFELFGEQDEYGSIEPFLRVTHGCEAAPGCSRVVDYKIPSEFLGKVYDMNVVALDISVVGEKEVC